MNKKYFRWPLIISIILLICGLFYYRLRTFSIDTDVIGYLPQNDQVLSDARYVIRHLPYQDRVFIDVSCDKQNKDTLVKGANFIEDKLQKSGLFKKVGIDDMQNQFPALIGHIMKNLPVMFDEEELNSKIKPLLSRKNINDALIQNLKTLQNLEGIGQAAYITADPLGFKNIVLGRLADLAPSKKAAIYNGKLLSEDGAHLLIIAELKGSGLNLKTCDDINALLTVISSDIKSFAQKGNPYTLNPVGAYRAVLDNERTTKKDTENAVTISTIVIALLLIVGFPRPLVGLLALVPSIMGTMIAFIVYSLIHKSLSVLAIGFGGAIISFTVDYGITYLLFLDRPYETYGLKATKEVWSLGLLAMLTTAISFAFLFISGFPALAQIGEFAALGVLFTYICVHAFFPVVFPVMKPAKRKGFVPLKKIVRMIFSGGKYKFFGAIVFCAVMLFFAKPDFRIDLASMNSVSSATLDSENLVKKVWGDIFNRIYLLSEGFGIEELQSKGDRLSSMLKNDEKSGANKFRFFTFTDLSGQRKNEK